MSEEYARATRAFAIPRFRRKFGRRRGKSRCLDFPQMSWARQFRLCRPMCGGGCAPPTEALLLPGYARVGGNGLDLYIPASRA
jgi:hypothetical protein